MTAMDNVETVHRTNGKDHSESGLNVVKKREIKREARLTGDLVENGRQRASSLMVRSLGTVSDTKHPVESKDATTFEDFEPIVETQTPMAEAEAPTHQLETVEEAASTSAAEPEEAAEENNDYLGLFLKFCIVFFGSAIVTMLLI